MVVTRSRRGRASRLSIRSNSCCTYIRFIIVFVVLAAYLAKADKVAKERVIVRLETELNNTIKMVPIDMRKDTEHLLIYLTTRRHKHGCRWKLGCGQGRKFGLRRKSIGDVRHHVVHILGCWKADMFALRVDPCVISAGAGGHGSTRFGRAEFNDDAMKIVNMLEKFKYYKLERNYYRLEVAYDLEQPTRGGRRI